MKYKQYMYHFPEPHQSIDIREISESKLIWCKTYALSKSEVYIAHNRQTVRVCQQLLKDHFPEELI